MTPLQQPPGPGPSSSTPGPGGTWHMADAAGS